MPLNDLTSEYSINTISQKTNISVEVLEKLLNKDWENLQRAKVNGFLRIIERDFNLDLSDIKQEAKEFYATHKKESPNRPIDLIDAQSIGGGSGRFLANIITFLAIALVAYAIWFYFFSFNKTNNQSSNSSNGGLFNDSINNAKSLVGFVDSNSSAKSKESKKDENSTKNTSSQKALATDNSVAQNQKKSDVKTDKNEDNKSIKQFDITDIKKDENRANNTDNNLTLVNSNSIKSSNTTTNSSNSTITNLAIESSAIESSAISSNDTTVNSKIKDEVNSLLEENKTNLSATTDTNSSSVSEINAVNEVNNTTLVSDSNKTQQLVDKIGSFTIENSAKSIWIGLYNLDTKKRVVKVLAKNPFSYKLDGKRVAIVTGHNKFTIKTDNGISKNFPKKGRVYLLITEDEVKYITKKEYKKITKHKAW